MTARRGLLLAVPLVFFALFYCYPVTALVAEAFADGDRSRITEVLTSDGFAEVVRFTTVQALASTALTLVVALPATAVLSTRRVPGGTAFRALMTIPFVLPTVVVAGAFLALLDDLTGTVWAILAAHVFFNVAVVMRMVGGAWSQLAPDTEDAARLLGAGAWRRFTTVTLPLLRPALSAASAIVFLFTFTSFAIILLLGGPSHATIETEIWRYATRRLELDVAAAIGLVQIAAVLVMAVASTTLERRAAVAGRPVDDQTRRRPHRSPADRCVTVAAIAPVALLVTVPLVVLVLDSFDTGGLSSYRRLTDDNAVLGVAPLQTLANSVRVALLATVIAVSVGTAAAVVVARGRHLPRLLDLGLLLPLGTSAVTVGFGLFLAFDEGPLDWRTSWWLVPVAHALIGIPFVMRAVLPVLRGMEPTMLEAARTLGASPGRVWWDIELPIARRGLAVGAGFAFTVSMGEFGATSVLPRPADEITAPVAVFRLLSTPGDVLAGQAYALAVLLGMVVAGVVIAMERTRAGPTGW